MRQKPSLTASDADAIVAAARAEALKNKWAVSIAVVDEAGILWRLDRGDGANLLTPRTAEAKAQTAAMARSPTGALENMVKERPAVMALPGRMPVQGGIPIIVDGECIGGIGVSGVKSSEDEQVAAAGLKAIA